jgi:hypothetical protein
MFEFLNFESISMIFFEFSECHGVMSHGVLRLYIPLYLLGVPPRKVPKEPALGHK